MSIDFLLKVESLKVVKEVAQIDDEFCAATKTKFVIQTQENNEAELQDVRDGKNVSNENRNSHEGSGIDGDVDEESIQEKKMSVMMARCYP